MKRAVIASELYDFCFAFCVFLSRYFDIFLSLMYGMKVVTFYLYYIFINGFINTEEIGILCGDKRSFVSFMFRCGNSCLYDQ